MLAGLANQHVLRVRGIRALPPQPQTVTMKSCDVGLASQPLLRVRFGFASHELLLGSGQHLVLGLGVCQPTSQFLGFGFWQPMPSYAAGTVIRHHTPVQALHAQNAYHRLTLSARPRAAVWAFQKGKNPFFVEMPTSKNSSGLKSLIHRFRM